MEHLIESVLEFLFSFIKFETEQMPENIECKETFKISMTNKLKAVALSVTSIINVILFIFAFLIKDRDTKYFFLGFYRTYSVNGNANIFIF